MNAIIKLLKNHPRLIDLAMVVFAMVCLMILTLTGKDNNAEIVSALSALMGAGARGYMIGAFSPAAKEKEKETDKTD